MDEHDPISPQQRQTLESLGLDPSCDSSSRADRLIEVFGATHKQIECLARMGVQVDGPIGKGHARLLIQNEVDRRRQLPPTPRQEQFLRKRGRWHPGISRGDAYDLIAMLVHRDKHGPRPQI